MNVGIYKMASDVDEKKKLDTSKRLSSVLQKKKSDIFPDLCTKMSKTFLFLLEIFRN